MTTPLPINVLLSDLVLAFPRQQIATATLSVYASELEDIHADALEHAVRRLIRCSEWFPTIRAIREAAAEWTLDLPTESSALTQVEARVGWSRQPEETRPDAPPVHHLVKEALHHVGGFYAFKTADQPAVIIGQFLKLYREMRSTAIRDVQTGTLALGRGADHPALAVSCNA